MSLRPPALHPSDANLHCAFSGAPTGGLGMPAPVHQRADMSKLSQLSGKLLTNRRPNRSPSAAVDSLASHQRGRSGSQTRRAHVREKHPGEGISHQAEEILM